MRCHKLSNWSKAGPFLTRPAKRQEIDLAFFMHIEIVCSKIWKPLKTFSL